MAGQLNIHSFINHVITVNGRTLEGFGEGDDVVTVEYREDGITDTVGADGRMQASVSANESATINLKLLAGSEDNDYLEDLYFKFKNGSIGGISVSIFDSFTGRGQVATTGYIPKLANESKGAKAQDREWSIIVPKIDIQRATNRRSN